MFSVQAKDRQFSPIQPRSEAPGRTRTFNQWLKRPLLDYGELLKDHKRLNDLKLIPLRFS